MNKEVKEALQKFLKGVFVAVTLRLLIRFSPSEKLVRILLPIALIYGFISLLPRRKEAGIRIAMIGTAANLLVVLANKGLMPVQRSDIGKVRKKSKLLERAEKLPVGSWIKGSHAFVDEDKARLNLLSDRIALNIRGTRGVASIGDMILYLGAIVILFESVRQLFQGKKSQPRLKTI